MQKLLKVINAVHIPNWLILILALSLILRIPSFFEPYSYGDETIYLTLGEAARQGKTLYKDVHDNKPPLIYYTAAVAGNLFWFKAILAFWSLLTIVLFWKLVQTLFPNKIRLHKISTLIFALLTSLPLLEGNIANAENFMIGLSIAGFLILFAKKEALKNIFLAGILFSLGTLFKVPAAFDAPVIVFYWLITTELKDIKNITRKTFFLALGFILPIAITFIWYAFKGALHDYLISGFLQNFGYLSTFRPDDAQKSFLVKNGPLLLRGGITLFGVAMLFFARKRLSKQFIFLTIWLLMTLFAVTLSERPYPHYLLQSVGPVALMFGMLFTFPSLEQVLVILPLTLAFAVPVYYKFWYYSTSAYYERFLSFATNRISKDEYLSKFGGHVPIAYDVAQFIDSTTQKSDQVFIWGSESQTIYALARRLPPIKYVAQYHISDFGNINDITNALNSSIPRVIAVLPGAPPYPELSKLVASKYILAKQTGARIYISRPSNLKD